jgi:hypothetical protein
MHFRVVFMVDDRFSDGKHNSTGSRGTRTWAFARIKYGQCVSVHPLKIVRRIASARTLNSPKSKRARDDEATAYRFAIGKVVVDPTECRDLDIHIEVFSIHEWMVPERGDFASVLHQDLDQNRTINWPKFLGIRNWAGNRWLEDLIDSSIKRVERLANDHLPIRETPSRIRLDAEEPSMRKGKISSAAIKRVLQASSKAELSDVKFLAGCCRYPGFPFDRDRVDESVARVMEDVGTSESADPAFAVLLGDLIYADYSAGIVDALSPTERFVERHRLALSRSNDKCPSLGDMLAQIPVVMAPDDHEYIDGYPTGPPLVGARPYLVKSVQEVARVAALDAYRYFQSSCSGIGRKGWVAFETGLVRILTLDSRSLRKVHACGRTIFTVAQRRLIQTWLHSNESREKLNVIATGSVVFPGLKVDDDPSNPTEDDSFNWAPNDRRWLLTQLAEACLGSADFRFVLLSGDYHVSIVTQVALADAGQPPRIVGAAVVAPPMYAPMPYINALPRSLNFAETVQVSTTGGPMTWSLMPLRSMPMAQIGSAIAEMTVQRRTSTGSLYELAYKASLMDYATGAPNVVSVAVTL